MTIGATALEQRGLPDVAQHFIVARAGDAATFLMKKQPFNPFQIARLRPITQALEFEVIYLLGLVAVSTLRTASPVPA